MCCTESSNIAYERRSTSRSINTLKSSRSHGEKEKKRKEKKTRCTQSESTFLLVLKSRTNTQLPSAIESTQNIKLHRNINNIPD
jgi:hypothetical protein